MLQRERATSAMRRCPYMSREEAMGRARYEVEATLREMEALGNDVAVLEALTRRVVVRLTHRPVYERARVAYTGVLVSVVRASVKLAELEEHVRRDLDAYKQAMDGQAD